VFNLKFRDFGFEMGFCPSFMTLRVTPEDEKEEKNGLD
jgi:hypothetical protein